MFPIEHDVNDFTLQLAVIVTIYMTLLAREEKKAGLTVIIAVII